LRKEVLVRKLPVAVSGRWNADVARVVLAALDDSGLSVAAFATANRLDAQRLHAWRRRLERAPRFVELVARSQRAPSRIEVLCPSGHVVRLDAEGLELLGPVLAIVDQSC
jgi:hypothetical protein